MHTCLDTMANNSLMIAAGISISILLIIVSIFLIGNGNSDNIAGASKATLGANTVGTVNTEGKQILELVAKGGYSPNVINAKANTDSVLRVKTNSTFDCTSTVNIPALGINKNLPSTGTTDIAIKAQAPGAEIVGTCAMGMFRFTLKFT